MRMDSKRVLSLLGLALRGGNLAVGEEPVEAAARARDARVILLASDAAAGTCRRAEHFAQTGQCLWLRAPFTKEELGRALGRASVALAAVTDTGLANAVLHRLAEGDPAYAEAAAQMEVKAKRARERQEERLAHERNVRRGKRKPARAPERPAKRPAPAEQRGDSSAPPQRRTARKGPPRPTAKRGRPGPGARAKPYAHSHPVKKGKGSFRKREG